MPSLVSQIRTNWPKIVADYIVRDLTGLLSLVAVAAFDVGSSPAGSGTRFQLLALHSLLFVCFVGLGIIVRWRPISGHLILSIFVAIQLLLVYVGSNATTQIALCFMFSAYAHEVLDDVTAYFWVIGFGVATMVGFSLLTGNPVLGILTGLGTLGGYLFIGNAARNRRIAEAAREESQRLLHELEAAHEQLKYHAHEAEALAAAEERNRLARELHDTLGHRLTVAAVQLEGAQRLITRDADKAVQMVGVVRNQVLDGLTELRQTVAALRSPIEADLALPAAIKLLANQYAAATGLQVRVQISDRAQQHLEHLSRNARHTLFRTAQEGLTNVQKHAAATTAWIIIDLASKLDNQDERDNQEQSPTVQLTVHDNGRGMAESSPPSGFGLRGLAERAAQVNGTFDIQASPYGGTALSVTVAADQSQANGVSTQ
jgi:signal transduction histidine kinase